MLIRVDFVFKGNQDKCTKFADAKMSQIFLGPGQPDLNFFFAFLCRKKWVKFSDPFLRCVFLLIQDVIHNLPR